MAVEIRGMAPLFQVYDMPTSIAFYRDVLGFEVVTTSTPRAASSCRARSSSWDAARYTCSKLLQAASRVRSTRG